MKATDWEFTNRALVFGLIFGVSFLLYTLDPQNSTIALAIWLGAERGIDPDLLARCLLALAAFLLVVAAFLRTWASSYLQANVVYAATVKTESLVADGPYRLVRNPLYFGNILMAAGMGAMMSRAGFILAVTAMVVFSYRLIFREEAELRDSQGASYDAYCKAVPRLLPAPRPRIARAGRIAQWNEGFKAESWYWGFAVSVIVFAITLRLVLFFLILGASVAALWGLSFLQSRESAKKID